MKDQIINDPDSVFVDSAAFKKACQLSAVMIGENALEAMNQAFRTYTMLSTQYDVVAVVVLFLLGKYEPETEEERANIDQSIATFENAIAGGTGSEAIQLMITKFKAHSILEALHNKIAAGNELTQEENDLVSAVHNWMTLGTLEEGLAVKNQKMEELLRRFTEIQKASGPTPVMVPHQGRV